MDTETLLTTTRSVRRKLDLERPVEAEVLEDCLRIAVQAPIAGYMQSALRWVVVRDPELKAKIAEPARAVGHALHEQFGHLVSPRTLASAEHLLDVFDRIPVFVICCLQGKPEGGNGELTAFYGSAFPALWNLQLALRTRGLASTFASQHLHGHERAVGELLGIPEDVTQIAMVAIGYSTQADFSPAVRPQPIEEITYLDGWGRIGS